MHILSLVTAHDDLKKNNVRCLDCNAEVCAKVKSALGRDENSILFLFSTNRT